jgi:hypothetical protein
MAEVIILMSPANSSHESPAGTGTNEAAAGLRQQREYRRLKRGQKPWKRGVWVTARSARQGDAIQHRKAMHSRGPMRGRGHGRH